MDMTRTIRALGGLMAAATLLASCSVSKPEAPDLAGPSVLGTSITVLANPDTLRQDGSSQATVVIVALDANAQPVRNLPVRVDIAVGGVVGDFGQISARNVVTGGDGRVSVLYTAPNPPVDPVDTGTIVQIVVTPTGTDYANAIARSASIRLVPPGVILPPNGTPTAKFVYSPSAPAAKADTTFDASASSDSDGVVVGYAWNFGDGATASGKVVTHQFQAQGTYTVSLTVTDDRGYTGTTTQAVSVTQSGNPTAEFVFSPSSPKVQDDIIFNASASKAAVGRKIVSYDWDFGTGRTGSGITVTKQYGTPATYVVTLVVTDDVGNTGSVSKSVTVQGSSLTASFVYSPTAPITTATTLLFDAGTSVVGQGHSIVSYEWNFGDGVLMSGKQQSHRYLGAGTYTVLLTIKDDTGQTATKTETITVT
jgi:PKD repeat protein